MKRVLLVAAVVACMPAALQAQGTKPGNGHFLGFIPITATGQASTMTELYRHGGGTARRPASLWRMSFNPQATVFGQFGVGMDMMLSSEGSDFRQNINQVGLNPTWRFVTLHAGDFNRDYSSYVLNGTRIRGGGVDLKPGKFEFSVQAGRAQRTVGSDAATAYKRSMLGASIGYGEEGSNRISISMMKAKDDPNSVEQSLVVVDTSFADTALVQDRLRFATAPQENLVLGVQTELSLFKRMLRLKGESGASLFTRDLRSKLVSTDQLGALNAVNGLQPVRLSTSGDYAYKGQAELNLSSIGLRGGYEHIGPGYTSLGLPYLISDRSGYNLGGNVALLQGKVAVQAETNHQSNNLLSQLATRTDRSSNLASVAVAPVAAFSMSTSFATTAAATPASASAPAVDARTLALTTEFSVRTGLLGKKTSLSLAYGYQKSDDRAPNSLLPAVTGNNVTAAVQMILSPTITLGPSLSAVSSSSENGEAQKNVLLGFVARAKFLAKQQLATSANVTNTFSAGRQVFSARADAAYPLPYQTRLTLQARHLKYSAFAGRPGFNESFLTVSVSRSFQTH